MSNIKDKCCKQRLQDLVLAGWPPCCATSFVVVVVVVVVVAVVGPMRPWSMPLAIFTMRKELHGFYFYACMWSCSYSYTGLRLGAPINPLLCACPRVHSIVSAAGLWLLRFQISPTQCGRKTFYPFSSVDEKHLMRFKSETSVFKFLRRSMDGALNCLISEFVFPSRCRVAMQIPLGF